ncbi:MAG: sugar phosphate isomerase/epimerase family protein [Candidatus Azambacteria bacterium]|nr:sugar phosphate isomerase/epimerase family protein [Candidatus Azambacteria bacterium]
MMPKIGIMQGRLSPPQNGRFQFFPKNWQAEFLLAKELGFNSIEWIYEEDNKQVQCGSNPILDRGWREQIRIISSRCNVGVHSICADYFMNYGFFESDAASVYVLSALIHVAMSLKIKTIVLPFLEEFAIKNQKQEMKVIKNIDTVLGICHAYGVRLALETELDAKNLKRFIKQFRSSYVGVCYDLGNTASYGHDSPKDIELLGNLIFEVHVKDRKRSFTQSVYLGEGDVDFTKCFRALREIGFCGPYILQAYRGDNYLNDAKKQLEFVKNKMEALQWI